MAGTSELNGTPSANIEAASPIGASERIGSMDLLRGVALMGILVMNIPWFAFYSSAYFNPTLDGGFEGADFVTWLGSHLLFDQKMMSTFAMLFGAGFLIFIERAAAKGHGPSLYYRRLGWLALFGLAHAYVLWYGDILFTYAISGLLLYPLRKLPAWALATLGVGIASVAMGVSVGLGASSGYARENIPEAYAEMAKEFAPSAEVLSQEAAARLGSYGEHFVHNAQEALFMQTGGVLIWGLWRSLGMMLLGMALMKWGVLSGARSARFYAVMMSAGFLVGLPIVAGGVVMSIRSEFDFVDLFLVNGHFNYIGSMFVALGWIGLVMLVFRLGVSGAIGRAIAAMGQMALTNYLGQSLIMAVIFNGWGLGWFRELSRSQTVLVVGGIWLAQLILSPLWLSRFRFGPAEWLWRSLTYWKRQPMVRAA